MNFISTRGGEAVSPSQAILKGIAPGGGLYVPETFPAIFKSLQGLEKMSYQDLAVAVLGEFLTDFPAEELRACVNSAYNSGFEGGIAPLTKAGEAYFLELFHGRTSAFKDMALSILPYLTISAAKRSGMRERAVILTATSGDTGKAALEAFAGVPGTYIAVFFPNDGVSYIQKKQMQTQEGDNALVLGIQGNFDDAQKGVKAIFNDTELNARLKEYGFTLSSANSINIGRLLPQLVYYYYAYGRILESGGISAGEPVDFTVPTGNFGNILAGYYAKMTGLPIGRLICASNENNVLCDFFSTGVYDRNRPFYQTTSPSMDILVSSNLERLLYHLCDDSEKIKTLMDALSLEGRFEFALPKDIISGGFATIEEADAAIREVFAMDYVMDPHTAVAYATYGKLGGERPNIILATASPYKFAPDVCAALGSRGLEAFDAIERLRELSGVEIPRRIYELKNKPILHSRVCKDMPAELLNFLNLRAD